MAASKEPKDPTVAESVRRDLAAVAKLDKDLAEGSLAATALRLARELDVAGNSATSKAMCAKALNETLAELRELAPEQERDDEIDELRGRRNKRRGEARAAG